MVFINLILLFVSINAYPFCHIYWCFWFFIVNSYSLESYGNNALRSVQRAFLHRRLFCHVWWHISLGVPDIHFGCRPHREYEFQYKSSLIVRNYPIFLFSFPLLIQSHSWDKHPMNTPLWSGVFAVFVLLFMEYCSGYTESPSQPTTLLDPTLPSPPQSQPINT